MLRKFKLLIAPTLAAILLFANLYVFSIHSAHVASAHNWDGYHWNKGGSAIYIYHWWEGGAYRADANAAMNDFWNKVGILYNYWTTSHTDVSVWDANYGATGWGGLAELKSLGWDWGCWCYRHIEHGHARYNSYYNSGSQTYRQGVFCQEIFHTYGFDHDNYGNCMGLGYYAGSDYRLNSHNNTDFYNRYRNH